MKYIIKINPDLLLKIKDHAPNSNFSEDLFVFRDDLITQGMNPTKRGLWLEVEFDTQKASFDMTDFSTVMSTGGSIEGFNPWVKIPEANINDEIPEGLPYRMTAEEWDYTDEENPVLVAPSRPKQWVEWFGTNYPPTIHEGFYYYVSAGGNNGATMTSTELVIINNEQYSELINSMPTVGKDNI